MDNKELYNQYEIIEYLERVSVYDQDVILSDGENEYTAVLSCDELCDIELITEN